MESSRSIDDPGPVPGLLPRRTPSAATTMSSRHIARMRTRQSHRRSLATTAARFSTWPTLSKVLCPRYRQRPPCCRRRCGQPQLRVRTIWASCAGHCRHENNAVQRHRGLGRQRAARGNERGAGELRRAVGLNAHFADRTRWPERRSGEPPTGRESRDGVAVLAGRRSCTVPMTLRGSPIDVGRSRSHNGRVGTTAGPAATGGDSRQLIDALP